MFLALFGGGLLPHKVFSQELQREHVLSNKADLVLDYNPCPVVCPGFPELNGGFHLAEVTLAMTIIHTVYFSGWHI